MARRGLCQRFLPVGYTLAQLWPLTISLGQLGAAVRMNAVVSKSLDRAAISMAVICGIHCLVTPVLLVALPLLATTFWVDENFHLWMLLFVIPTTTLAVWSGCRRHKDKWVFLSAAVGIGILVSALVAERLEHSHSHEAIHAHSHEALAGAGESGTGTPEIVHLAGGSCCELTPVEGESSGSGGGVAGKSLSLSWHALLNTLGGCFLVAGHTRNFLLCRKDNCSHGESCCPE